MEQKVFLLNRFLPRFGLGTLLLVVTCMAIGTWWLTRWQREVWAEQQAIEKCLAQYNAVIHFSDEIIAKRPQKKNTPSELNFLFHLFFGKNPYSHAQFFTVRNNPKVKDFNHCAELKWIDTIRVSKAASLTDVSGLGNLPNLEIVIFSKCDKLEDLSPLAGLPTGCMLSVSDCDLANDFRFLADAKGIDTLMIDYADSSLSFPPGEEISIKELFLKDCNAITSLDWLEGNRSLESLDLNFADKLVDVDVLSSLPQLETISFNADSIDLFLPHLRHIKNLTIIDSYSKNLTNFDFLKETPELLSFKFVGNSGSKLKSIDSIEHLKHLEHIDISGIGANHLGCLSHLENLKSVKLKSDVDDSKLVNLDVLANLATVETVHLKNFNHSHLKVIQSLPNLEELYLFNTAGMTNLDWLKPLQKVRVLAFSCCDELSDLKALQQLPNLEELFFSDCGSIVDTTELEKLTQLKLLEWNGTFLVGPPKPQ